MVSISAAGFSVSHAKEGNNKFSRRILHKKTGTEFVLCTDTFSTPIPVRYYRRGAWEPGGKGSTLSRRKMMMALWLAMRREGVSFGQR